MHKMILDLKFIYDGANVMESSWDFDMEVFVLRQTTYLWVFNE